MTKDPRRFYVYAYLRSKDSERGVKYSPYYIGKGSGNRCFSNKGRTVPIPKDKAFIVFIQEGLEEEEAFSLERYCIAMYGRVNDGTGILHNRCDGGEGVAGVDRSGSRNNFYGKKHSSNTKTMLSQKNQGSGNGHYGKQHSVKAKGKMAVRHAKYLYELVDQKGEIYMTENLRDFCRQYTLDRRSMGKLLNGQITSYKGWKICIAEVLK